MMQLHKLEQYQDMIGRLYSVDNKDNKKTLARVITFQVTDDCNLNCTYCYQCNKGKRRLNIEDAKLLIDKLLNDDLDGYITKDTSPAIILEFIGGEPFLEIDLIDDTVNYFYTQAIKLKHPWATKFIISICSNGVLHNTLKVQKFLSKYKNVLSYSITIDGNKELHDSCRVFHDGKPSYDIAVAGAKDWMNKGGNMGSKITIAPENILYLFNAIIHMIELGYTEINANTVYERGWEIEHAKEFYVQLKKIADYFLENNLLQSHYCSLFEEDYFRPMTDEENDNWCGGTGSMLALDPNGKLFPCIRYMESSLGNDAIPYSIGDVKNGIGKTQEEKSRLSCLNCINRKTQSTDECYLCPIAAGCSWCSAYNYQVNGTPDKRVTYICDMHKARSLANSYLWNNYYINNNIKNSFELNCPQEWALQIISKNELETLNELQAQALLCSLN